MVQMNRQQSVSSPQGVLIISDDNEEDEVEVEDDEVDEDN
jgi:hypothetical protein